MRIAGFGYTVGTEVLVCGPGASGYAQTSLAQDPAVRERLLASLDGEFAKLYSAFGRESIPPERLLRAMLLQAFFTIRSEHQLMEQLNYNLVFRWFVGLGIDGAVWVPTIFSNKNRDRLLDADVAANFMSQLLAHTEVRGLLSDEHFSVDGTLIEAWASMKSFQPIAAPPPIRPVGTARRPRANRPPLMAKRQPPPNQRPSRC